MRMLNGVPISSSASALLQATHFLLNLFLVSTEPLVRCITLQPVPAAVDALPDSPTRILADLPVRCISLLPVLVAVGVQISTGVLSEALKQMADSDDDDDVDVGVDDYDGDSFYAAADVRGAKGGVEGFREGGGRGWRRAAALQLSFCASSCL
eukprot:351377-Chlamydomonas_euryale.AAC.7